LLKFGGGSVAVVYEQIPGCWELPDRPPEKTPVAPPTAVAQLVLNPNRLSLLKLNVSL
jgi:hypothetical protein